MLTRRRSTGSSRAVSLTTGALATMLLAPLVADRNGFTVAAVVIAAMMCRLTLRYERRPRLAWLGAAVAVAALLLIGVTPTGAITLSIGLVLGYGVALTLPRIETLESASVIVGVVLGVAVLVVSLRLAALVVVVAAVVTTVNTDERARVNRRGVALTIAMPVLTVGLLLWVAANDPTVQWFGKVVTHGDRNGNEVAITFDDGPDEPFSLEVADILDAHGAKGTFFEVGQAVDARPDIARALNQDGHLLANHSFHHDSWRWLDPRYPEADRTQTALRNLVGVCPAFFRPPHGQRTPFMLAHVRALGMHPVTWDVSASDWTETNGSVVAHKILQNVRPGSIILLHDGIDGTVTADRSVLKSALPEILDGLQAKGLRPVRLDELLRAPGYLPSC